MFRRLKEELMQIKYRDPSAKSLLEIYLLYPGVKALRSYRKAHWFYVHNMKIIARFISERSRKRTGIEIHPGANIGKGVFIDHGMGVVIGETAAVGDGCIIYQGVTLGGTGKHEGKRHPTIGKNVLIGSGAKVLGPFKVGDNARIAAGAVVLREVPEGATAVGVPARVVRINGLKNLALDQIHVSDPVAQQFCKVNIKLRHIISKIDKLENSIESDR